MGNTVFQKPENLDDFRKYEQHPFPSKLQVWFDEKMPGLKEVLQETQSAIAGSFPLQYLLDEFWSFSDVDIWTPNKNNAELIASYLLKRGFGMPVRINPLTTDEDTYSRLHRYVLYIYQFRPKVSNLQPIQVIVLKPNITLIDVITSFDIDACCVFTDGEQIVSAYEQTDLKTKTTCLNSSAIYQQSPYEWFRTLRRVEKYIDRGFTFDWQNLRYGLYNSSFNKFLSEGKLDTFSNEPLLIDNQYFGLNNFDAYITKWNNLADTISVKQEIPHLIPTLQAIYFYWKGQILYEIPLQNQSPQEGLDYINEPAPEKCYDLIMIDEVDFKEQNSTTITIEIGKMVYCYGIEQFLKLFTYSTFTDPVFYFEHAYLAENTDDPIVEKMAKLESSMSPLLHYLFEIFPSLKVLFKYACRKKKKLDCSEQVISYEYKIAKDLKFYLDQAASAYESETKRNWDDDIQLIDKLYKLNNIITAFLNDPYGKDTDFSQIYYSINSLLFKYLSKVKSERNVNLYFECEAKGVFKDNPTLQDSYFMLRLGQNFIIPFRNVLNVLEHVIKDGNRHFKLLPQRDEEGKQLKLNLTSNYELTIPPQRRDASYVSADHCQVGTDKLVYKLVQKKKVP